MLYPTPNDINWSFRQIQNTIQIQRDLKAKAMEDWTFHMRSNQRSRRGYLKDVISLKST